MQVQGVYQQVRLTALVNRQGGSIGPLFRRIEIKLCYPVEFINVGTAQAIDGVLTLDTTCGEPCRTIINR